MAEQKKKIYSAVFTVAQNAVTLPQAAVSVYTDKPSRCQTKGRRLTFPHSEKKGSSLQEIKKRYTFAVASQERRCIEKRLKKVAK
jgi:chromosome segregation and condensation protein ScpB